MVDNITHQPLISRDLPHLDLWQQAHDINHLHHSNSTLLVELRRLPISAGRGYVEVCSLSHIWLRVYQGFLPLMLLRGLHCLRWSSRSVG